MKLWKQIVWTIGPALIALLMAINFILYLSVSKLVRDEQTKWAEVLAGSATVQISLGVIAAQTPTGSLMTTSWRSLNGDGMTSP